MFSLSNDKPLGKKVLDEFTHGAQDRLKSRFTVPMTWPKAEKSTRNSVNALSRLRAFDVKWTSGKLNEKKNQRNKAKYHHYWLENYAFYGRKKIDCLKQIEKLNDM